MTLLVTSLAFLSAVHGDETMNDSIEAVHSFWFGSLRGPEHFPNEKAQVWFGGGPEVDFEIKERFEGLVHSAGRGELDDWKQTPKGRLALILLLDQFSRNIYRATPMAFSYDPKGLSLALEGLDLGIDRELFPIERFFFYLPLEHSEQLEVQKLSVSKFNDLMKVAPTEALDSFKMFKDYADRHLAVIERFGRFPHRNAILGRESSYEEVEFLKTPGSSF